MNKNINKLFCEILQYELTPSDFEGINHCIPDKHIMKVQQQILREVNGINVNQTGCCIVIRRDRIGNLYPTNICGHIEDVVGRRIFLDIDDDYEVSDKVVLVLVLQSMIYSGYGRHRYLEDTAIMEWVKEGISTYNYLSYPCLAKLSHELDMSLVTSEIADVEDEDHLDRVPFYLEMIYYIRRIVPDDCKSDSTKPIFIEVEDGDVKIYGNPDDDSLIDFIARPIDVYDCDKNLSKEKIAVLLIHDWSMNGAGLDQSDSFMTGNNHFRHMTDVLFANIKQKISKGELPIQVELKYAKKYQSLAVAYDICHKLLPNQSHYKHLLNMADEVHTIRLESPEETPLSDRYDFFDNAISIMRLRDRYSWYNAVIMLIVTPPSCPMMNAKKYLANIFTKHLEHNEIVESAFYHGYMPSKNVEEDNCDRTSLHILLLNIHNN